MVKKVEKRVEKKEKTNQKKKEIKLKEKGVIIKHFFKQHPDWTNGKIAEMAGLGRGLV